MEVERVESVARLTKRPRDAHKGSFGRVLVVGGSRGMVGAVALAANAALRGGAGLVTFAAPETVQLTIAGLCPCATSLPLSCRQDGRLAVESVRQMLQAAGNCDVIAAGPGLAVGPGQKNLIRAALEQDKPLVIDADGLNNLAGIDGWPASRRCPLVLTPHPGEFSRLTGRPIADIQASREEAALQAARQWIAPEHGTSGIPARQPSGSDMPAQQLVLVLKGAGTVVTDGRRVYVNRTGNPGMASGGTGDVLTGLVAAFIGQGLEPFDAACLAAHCHGRAGDLAAAALGEVSMIASDLLDYLPAAIKEQSC